MAVSKRLRFEILRRDNHTCRYCGRAAPEVKLTIDHVIPETLGGTDDPENLVSACPDCNSGKSSVPADAPLVASVSAQAELWAAAMKQAAEENGLYDNTAVYEAVVNAWTSFRRNQIPKDYRETIDQFLAAGLPPDDVVQMAHVADAKPAIYNRWSYFCGCCWTRIRKLQERATEILEEQRQRESKAQLAAERKREVCRWFKPLWYGTAFKAGHHRIVQVPAEYLDEMRLDYADRKPGDSGYIDEHGRQLCSYAPRSDDWIDVVDRYLRVGLTKEFISDIVHAAMYSPADHENCWAFFVELCSDRLDELADATQGASLG